jgi:hypothetical protein
MEYINLVNRIVEAEHTAKALVHEAEEKQAHLQSDLDKEIAAMRTGYFARADRRLELVRQTEQQGAQEAIAQLDEKLHTAMEAVESAYARNKDRWVDTLFAMIVGVNAP